MTTGEAGFNYMNCSDIFQSELAVAADVLARSRLEIGWQDTLDPAEFFKAASEICAEFYNSYAPDHSLDDLMQTEVIECVTFAARTVRHGRPFLRLE